jgi:Mor family transcriptional regulator
LEEIIDIIGHELAARLVNTFGGCSLYVPRRIDETHKIAQCIGWDAAKKLSSRYLNTALLIPRNSALKRRLRNDRISADRKSGLSVNDLAIKYELTTRQIVTICK